LENSHVFSALIRKLHDARVLGQGVVELWGSGIPRREFIFSEDVAQASIFMMENANKLDNGHYNLGTGVDFSIQELAAMIAGVVGYKGEIKWDKSKPDGPMQKLLDSAKFLSLGWRPTTTIELGLEKTYAWFLEHVAGKAS
jgi:GDP-L-fucose synthase